MKRFFNIILYFVLGTIVSTFIAIHLSPVQDWLGGVVSSALGDQIGAKVKVERVEIGLPDRVILDNVCIYDQQNEKMLTATRASAKVQLMELSKGRLAFSLIQLFSFNANLYQSIPEGPTNFQFALDSLASRDSTKEDDTFLRFNSVIMRRGKVSWHQRFKPRTPGRFNISHIDVTDISLLASVKELSRDSIDVRLKRLSANEKSGLVLENLSMAVLGNRNGINLTDFKLQMPHTSISVPSFTAKLSLKDSTSIESLSGNISPSRITPSDFSALLPDLANINNPIRILANVSGTPNLLNINDLEIDSELTGNGFPDMIERLRRIHASGNCTLGKLSQSALLDIDTQLGAANIKATKEGDRIAAEFATKEFDLGSLLDIDELGMVSAKAAVSSGYHNQKFNDTSVKGFIESIAYKGYNYSNIDASAELINEIVKGKVAINDPNATIALEGTAKLGKRHNSLDALLNISSLNLQSINLSTETGISAVSGQLSVKAQGSNIDNVTGEMWLKDLSLKSDKNGNINLKNLILNSGIEDTEHVLTMRSDFADLSIRGNFTNSSLLQSTLNSVVKQISDIPGVPKYKPTTNQFNTVLTVIDPTIPNQLLGTAITLDEPLKLTGVVDDLNGIANWELSIPRFSEGGSDYSDFGVKIEAQPSNFSLDASIKALNNNRVNTNYMFDAVVEDNSVLSHIGFTHNRKKRSSAMLATKTSFNNSPLTGFSVDVDILPSELIMLDSKWTVMPATARYTKNHLELNNIRAIHNSQHIIINGNASQSPNDSITVDLKGIDVEYIMDIVNFHSVDFAGIATGKAYISNMFNNPKAYASLVVEDFQFEHGHMGTLYADASWNNDQKRIEIDAEAKDTSSTGKARRLPVKGYVDIDDSSLDLNIYPDNANLDFLATYCTTFMRNIEAEGSGYVRVVGPFSRIMLLGDAYVKGGVDLIALNTHYILPGDSVHLRPDDIAFEECPFNDTEGNKAMLNGHIRHNSFKNISFDLDIETNRILAFDFPEFNDNTFCGTVYAEGKADLHGHSSDIIINCDATPLAGTEFRYNASSPDAVRDQQFIKWATSENTTETKNQDEKDENDIHTNIYLNFLIHAQPDAALKLVMDERTGDYILLHGNGTMRASYYNKGAFSLFGQYLVQDGIYKLTIQNLISKEFKFQPGGTITFGGDPYEAPINLQALYTVSGVSLSDLNIGKSFSSNTIRVNCLMNITGSPQAPVVDFDMDLPTVNSDEKQMIRSFINSQNDMNQQVVYLLGIGRFYNQDNNNQSVEQTNQQTQASKAMNSFLSGTISSQINSVLSNVIRNRDWNFGANISTGTEGWYNAEYEGIVNGSLFNNRLLINGQFGYRDNATTATSSFIGDFDVRYLLVPTGDVAVRMYNQANDRYFTRTTLNTQGLGLILKRDFGSLKDLFKRKR